MTIYTPEKYFKPRTIQDIKQEEFTIRLVEKINKLTTLPSDHFDHFYLPVINEFLFLSQFNDPEDINEHLNRVINCLKIRRSIILPKNSDAETINSQKDLWTYAVFFGAITFKLSRLLNLKIICCNENDKKWFRFSLIEDQILPSQKFALLGCNPNSNFQDILYSKRLFSKHSILWLYRDQKAFNFALNLAGNPSDECQIGQLLLQAKPYAEPRDKTASKTSYEAVNDTKISPPSAPSKLGKTDSEEQKAHKEPNNYVSFEQWLKSELSSPNISRFTSRLENGIAIADPAIFQQYCKSNQISENIDDVKNRILSSLDFTECPYPISFPGAPKSKAITLNESLFSTKST